MIAAVITLNQTSMLIRTYEDWLTLPHEGKVSQLSQWDPYRHEIFWFPMMAAARLASRSDVSVIDIRVGIDHGGTYILRLGVDDQYAAKLPTSMTQDFEGFPVVWSVVPYHPPISDDLLGEWTSRGEAGTFEFSIHSDHGNPVVSARSTADGTPFEVHAPSFHNGNSVEFYIRQDGRPAGHHRLEVPTSENCCNHHVSVGQLAKRT